MFYSFLCLILSEIWQVKFLCLCKLIAIILTIPGKVDTKKGMSTPQNICFPSLYAQEVLGLDSTIGWKLRPVHFTPHTAPLCQREIRTISSLTYIWGVENPLSIHQELMG